MAVELAEIFRQYGPAYRQKYADRIPSNHLQAMRAIENCRTAALGGQAFVCPDCQEVQYSYHSCRNRHCPKCQCEKGQEWLEQQDAMLLPVPYFLLTSPCLRVCAKWPVITNGSSTICCFACPPRQPNS